jgi:pyridoxal phosphate enzyme (YggS family)
VESVVEPLRARLAGVEARLSAACARAGRQREEVTLVAVTKTVSVEVARTMASLGVRDLGENRPQELWKKAEAIPGVSWHLIGHLQRNKVARTLPLTALVHAVDSVRLLDALEVEAQKLDRVVPVLLEVNVSGEAAKQGFAPDDVPGLAAVLDALLFVRVRGLMTMAALVADPEECRPTFVRLRELRDELRQKCDRERHPLNDLSMGMSNDFEIAVEEGATLVRLGTVLFEGGA